MKRFILYISAFILLWGIWFFICPYYLRMLEGFNFFTTLPDFKSLNLNIPNSCFEYVSCFLLQFYGMPAIGAAVNAFITILMILSIDTAIRRFFKNADSLVWISFIAVPFYTKYLLQSLSLTNALICLAIAAACAIASTGITWKRKEFIKLPGIFGNRWIGAAIIAVCIGFSGHSVYSKTVRNGIELMSKMDYMAENQEWGKIIEDITPEEALTNDHLRKYALLALTQTSQLADQAFMYGISGINDFIYEKPETPMSRNFNMRFCNHLDMHNQAVYHAYQQGTLFALGLTFDAARSLADRYLEIKDYTLAKKYLEILSHSTCNKRWVKRRLPLLEAIKGETAENIDIPANGVFGNMEHDLQILNERYPEDTRYQHMLLCGLLAEKKGETFYKVFCNTIGEQYAQGARIPKVYQEALLVVLAPRPDELKKYKIDKEIQANFADFGKLLRAGKDNVAKRKYAGSYWIHLCFQR